MSPGQGLASVPSSATRWEDLLMLTVGIDPHKHVHVAVAVDADGRRIGRTLTVKTDAGQVASMLTWIRTIAGGQSVAWAIEDGRGHARLLADGLLLACHEVV